LGTKIAYAPLTRPEPFPPLRQAHYAEGLGQLAAPEEDPAGWTTLLPTTISGRLFDARDVSVTCTLSLAKPLQYTRGSGIPVHLSLSSSDPQALDLLSKPDAPVVKLLAYLEVKTAADKQALLGSVKEAKLVMRGNETLVLESRGVQSAVWWVDPAPTKEGEKKLFGEIHIGLGTTPPFDVPDARLRVCAHSSLSRVDSLAEKMFQYRVALMPFSAAGFAAPENPNAVLGESHRALATQDVDIVTAYASAGPGYKPVMVTPPSYAKPEPWPVSFMGKGGFL
jgi:hypothetical protein